MYYDIFVFLLFYLFYGMFNFLFWSFIAISCIVLWSIPLRYFVFCCLVHFNNKCSDRLLNSYSSVNMFHVIIIHQTNRKKKISHWRLERSGWTRGNQRGYDNLMTLKLCSQWPWPRPRVKQQSQLDRSFTLTRSCSIKDSNRLLCKIQTDL